MSVLHSATQAQQQPTPISLTTLIHMDVSSGIIYEHVRSNTCIALCDTATRTLWHTNVKRFKNGCKDSNGLSRISGHKLCYSSQCHSVLCGARPTDLAKLHSNTGTTTRHTIVNTSTKQTQRKTQPLYPYQRKAEAETSTNTLQTIANTSAKPTQNPARPLYKL